MKILVTNDDGYKAPGLQVLVDLLRPLGDLVIVAPKYHQSGMSMAVSMGMKPIAVKQLTNDPRESWWYVEGVSLDDICHQGIQHWLKEFRPYDEGIFRRLAKIDFGL